MKAFVSVVVLLVFLLVPCLTFSQSDWKYLPNAPVVDARFDDIYFIDQKTGWAVNGGGEIYKTDNAGESWVLQDDKDVYMRTIEFINDSTGFIGSLNVAVFKTTNAGETWERIDQDFPVVVPGICGISHFRNKMVMVGRWNSPAYVLHSVDYGKTWKHYNLSSQASSLVDCWYKSIDTVFVSGRKAGTQAAIILRSVDSGKNWTPVTPADTPIGYAWKLDFVTRSVGYASVEEMTGAETHILKTTNGGKSFQVIKALDVNIDAEGIGFINSMTGWIGGWSDGMYETNDGGITWDFIDHGKNINRYFRLNSGLMYAAGSSIYKFGELVTDVPKPIGHDIYTHAMEVFPNPSPFKYVDVKMTISVPTIAVLELYRTDGTYVDKSFEKSLERGEFTHRVSLERLLPGAYILVFKSNENSVRRKVIITKS